MFSFQLTVILKSSRRFVSNVVMFYQRQGDDEAEQLECLLVGAQQPHPGDHPDILHTSAANRSIGSTTGCRITEKAPTRAFCWLKGATTAFTFKTLLRHYAKQALTPW